MHAPILLKKKVFIEIDTEIFGQIILIVHGIINIFF